MNPVKRPITVPINALREKVRMLQAKLRALRAQLRRRSRHPPLIERLAGEQSPSTRMSPEQAALRDITHLLFEDAPFGALLLTAEGRVMRSNAALRRMVGRDVDLTRGAVGELIFAADAREAAMEEIARALSGRPHMRHDFFTRLTANFPALDEAERAADVLDALVSVSVAPLHEADGSLSGAMLRISDISVQKQLEAQLAQSQKLQAMGQLAGGIAHDFNNLLTAVLGAAESIISRPDLDPDTLDDVAQVQSSAQRGAALVRQLLAFGRQQTLQPRVLAVNERITDLSGLLKRLLGTKVRLELALELPGRSVRADPTQLDQVLVNLAVNARDAMADGGVLTLRSGHMTLYRPTTRGTETIPPGRYVMIEVRDTGDGIPPEVLPRIFDPFFTTKRESGGSGLGLSTVHGIIRQSDGFLNVESELGEGTRVRIYLPRWDGTEAVAIPRAPRGQPAFAAPTTLNDPVTVPLLPPELAVVTPAAKTPSAPLATAGTAPAIEQGASGPARATPGGGRHVLLVEDEEPVRRLAERTLQRQGWQVLSADCGEAAMTLLLQAIETGSAANAGASLPGGFRLAAVVTDMVMPGMDGATLVRSLRERLAAPLLPAILVSGYAEETLRADLDSAATLFLPKPYSLKDLASRLQSVTERTGAESLATGG